MILLYIISNIIYELSLYFLIYQSYIEGNNNTLMYLSITFVFSTFISGIPSTLHILKYPISRNKTQIDGYLKMAQYFVLFFIAPLFGAKYITIILCLMMLLSLVNLFVRYSVYIQLSDVDMKELSDRIDVDQVVNEKQNKWTTEAWKTIIPFFLLGLIDGRNSYFTFLILILIMIFEVRIIKKLYLIVISRQSDTLLKKFKLHVVLSMIVFMLLIIALIYDKTKMLQYFMVGAFTMTYVSIRKYLERF